MEDIVKLYTKIKDFDTTHKAFDKKIGLLNDKIARVR